MDNVIQFAPRKSLTAIKREVEKRTSPEVVTSEYQLYQLMQAASTMFQTQKFDIGERILSCCRAAGYQQWVLVDDDLQVEIDEADLTVAMFGPEEEA